MDKYGNQIKIVVKYVYIIIICLFFLFRLLLFRLVAQPKAAAILFDM